MAKGRSLITIIGAALVVCFIAATAWLWTPDKSRSELERTYLASPSDYVDVAGIRLHVRDTGPRDAPAVVLLHGLGASLHTWEPWAQALSPTFRVIRYDLPGFGLTGADPTGDYSNVRSMQILAELMDKLAVPRAAIIGNSMGGRLAWNFAAAHQDRVSKLVLISPDGFASPGFDYGKAPEVPSFLQLMKYALPKSMFKANLTPAYADPARLSDATFNRYYNLMLAPGVRGAMLDRMGQTILEQPEPLLKKIVAPVLLVWGDKDAMIPIANAADYLKTLHTAELVTLPGLGHVPHEEAPETSLQAVRAFLEK